MELSALPGSGPAWGQLEGRTEGMRDGKVSVRLASGSVMEIATAETWPPGTPVVLAAGSDGKIQILPKTVTNALAEARQSLWEALDRLVDTPQSKEIAQALAKNEYAQAAPLLAPEADGRPSSLLSEPAKIAPPATASMVDLLSQVEPGKFQASVAGASWELWSSPELATPQRFSAKAAVLPNGAALWTPTRAVAPQDAAPLPEIVKADPEGARLLLEHAGVVDAPPEVAEDLAHYLRQVADRLLDAKTGAASAERKMPSANPFPAEEPPSPTPTAGSSNEPAPGSGSIPIHESAKAAATPQATAAPRLDAETALRAFAAWSLEVQPDHPEMAALLGKGPSLPDILETLRQHLPSRSQPLPELSATLAKVLGKGRMDPEQRAQLEERILDALTRTSGTEPEDSPLAEASRALLGERLGELGREAMVRGEGVWTRQETSWQKERVVVHDRRRRGADARPDHHVAEIRLEPKGAGEIDARLVLDGRNLSVRMEARSPETARRLREHLSELRAALEGTGLSVSGVEVAKSASQAGGGSAKSRQGGGFDVRA